MHRTEGEDFNPDVYGDGTNLRGHKNETVPDADDGTRVTYQTLNALQEEVCNLITGAGLTVQPNAGADQLDGWTQLRTAIFQSQALGENALGNGSVTDSKLAFKTITGESIADGGITTDNLADGAVTEAKIADLGVTGAKVANKTLNAAKILIDNRTIVGSTDQSQLLLVDLVSSSNAALEYQSGTSAQSAGINVKDQGIATSMLADESVSKEKIGLGSVRYEQLGTQTGSQNYVVELIGNLQATNIYLNDGGLYEITSSIQVTDAPGAGNLTKVEYFVDYFGSAEVLYTTQNLNTPIANGGIATVSNLIRLDNSLNADNIRIVYTMSGDISNTKFTTLFKQFKVLEGV